MSWTARRWDAGAVLERLGAERAVDALPRTAIADRARLRLRLIELAAAVDRGDLPPDSAAAEFRAVHAAAADVADRTRVPRPVGTDLVDHVRDRVPR